ncbi:MAG: efflux RND transporter periplasmic adaptor subunit [Candidatus Cryptobacteroides sp.]
MRRISIEAFAAALLAVSACKGGNPAPAASHSYGAQKVDTSSVTISQTYPASVRGRQDIAIYPQVSGTITKVCVKEGQTVSKGQSLFVIDQIPFRAALQMAQANVEAARAAVATSQLVYDSKKQLFDEAVISEFDLLTAQNQLLSAKAGQAQAEAALVEAENDMEHTLVLSPADGVVGTIPYREGALVSAQSPNPLTLVSDNSEMYVYFSISEKYFLSLCREHGSMDEVLASIPELRLQQSDGSLYPYAGRIETISGVIDQSTGSLSCRAVFPNKGRLLHSGATGKILIPNTLHGVIVIPCGATYELQDQKMAYRVIDGRAKATRLSTALTDDAASYIVYSGLQPGDVIVTEGVGLIRDNSEIEVKL